MTDHRDDDHGPLVPEDATLVRMVAKSYAPPPRDARRRAAFDAALESRLARERWRFVPWLAATAVAGAAAALVFVQLPATSQDGVARISADAESETAFVLALAGDDGGDFERSLPAEYQAIASMLYTE
jgi:hypothetical protein